MNEWVDFGGACFTVILAVVGGALIIRAWIKPRPAEHEQNAPARAEAPPLDLPPAGRWLLDLIKRPFMVYDDMSSDAPAPAQNKAADPSLSQRVSDASAPTAMLSSASSDGLTADESAARAIAILLNAGLLTNRQKAIEQVFHCSVTAKSRPDTPYQKALKLVEQYQAPAKPEYVGDMIERVKREVAAEH